MALPVVTVTPPAILKGTTNGKLHDSILVNTPGQAGGYTVRLVAPAARAWRALCAAALKAGHVLKPSGPLDSYRPYDAQVREFTSRFVTYNTGTGITRTWNGVKYWLKPGVALAAVPGTSNHGWGLAVDTGEERDGDPGPESIDSGTLAWLVANEGTYGWSHEVQSEPWHIRYWAGDKIPAAVIAYEQSLVDEPEEDDDVIMFMECEVDGPHPIYDITGTDVATGKGRLVHVSSYEYVVFMEEQFGAKRVKIKGLPSADHWVIVTEAPPAEGGTGPTHDELVQAAFEGAQRAEKE